MHDSACAPHFRAFWELSTTATVAEVPFTFRARLHGRTKMRWAVVGAWISDLFRLWRLRSRPSAWAVDAAT